MKAITLLTTVALASALLATSASADTYVRGYYRADGTYVPPHYRSDANRIWQDNWSVSGNRNPYTGERRTRRRSRRPTLGSSPQPRFIRRLPSLGGSGRHP